MYKRIYLARINYAAKTKAERNEIEILIIETNSKISLAKDYVRSKENELKYMILNGESIANHNRG